LTNDQREYILMFSENRKREIILKAENELSIPGRRQYWLATFTVWRQIRDRLTGFLEDEPKFSSQFYGSAVHAGFDLGYSEATEESCGHLYHGKFIPKRKSLFEIGQEVFLETEVNPGSYNKLYGSMLPIEIQDHTITPSFQYEMRETGITDVMALFVKFALTNGFKLIVILTSALIGNDEIDWAATFADSAYTYSLLKLFASSTSSNSWDWSTCDLDVLAVFMETMSPSIKIRQLNIYQKLFDFFNKNGKTFASLRKFFESSSQIFPENSPTLLEAMIDMPHEDRSKAFATRRITEVSFKFVSATFNLIRDEVGTRVIGNKKTSYACGSRMCFFPFDTDGKAMLDPWVKRVGLMDCKSASPSDLPSAIPSDLPSAIPSDLPSAISSEAP
jgi:hypothetical protein